jgi:hypothetical protein
MDINEQRLIDSRNHRYKKALLTTTIFSILIGIAGLFVIAGIVLVLIIGGWTRKTHHLLVS